MEADREMFCVTREIGIASENRDRGSQRDGADQHVEGTAGDALPLAPVVALRGDVEVGFVEDESGRSRRHLPW